MAATVTAGIAVRGWKEMTVALHRLGDKGEFGVEYELQRRLRTVGERNAKAAERHITHKYPRRGEGDTLEGSMRVSVTRSRASVYSTSAHGGAQDAGAGPKAGWAARGPHIRRDRASKWAQKGVLEERDFTRTEMEGLVDWVVAEYESGFYL